MLNKNIIGQSILNMVYDYNKFYPLTLKSIKRQIKKHI